MGFHAIFLLGLVPMLCLPQFIALHPWKIFLARISTRRTRGVFSKLNPCSMNFIETTCALVHKTEKEQA